MENHSQSHIKNTTRIVSEKNCLDDFSKIIGSEFPGRELLFVLDEQTEKAAGKKLKQQCRYNGIEFVEMLLESEEPVISADYSYVPSIMDRINASGALPVAVGSGTINDLTKCASTMAGTPYVCVATATSVDGYCATGAALVKEGLKMTIPCDAPAIVFGDSSVLMSAPYDMTAAGYGDLYAKIPGGADWILADSLEIESIDSPIWDLVQSNLPVYLSDPENLAAKDAISYERLFKGLCETGIAMQLYGDSRPASGAEHMISHVWEMEHISYKGAVVSHGFKVSVGSVIMTMIMEEFCKLPVDIFDPDKIIAGRDQWTERVEKIKNHFPDNQIQEQIIVTCRNKWITDSELRRRVLVLRENWTEISEKLLKQISSSYQIINDLKKAGCPTRPVDIGRSKLEIRAVIEKAQMIRERFTILDCLYDLGVLPAVIDRVVGKME